MASSAARAWVSVNSPADELTASTPRSSIDVTDRPTSSSVARRRTCSSSIATLEDSIGFHGNQNRIDAASYRQLPLDERQRHEHGANLALLRIEREIPELRRGHDAANRESESASGALLPALQRFERDFGRPLHTDSKPRCEAALSSLASARLTSATGFQLPR